MQASPNIHINKKKYFIHLILTLEHVSFIFFFGYEAEYMQKLIADWSLVSAARTKRTPLSLSFYTWPAAVLSEEDYNLWCYQVSRDGNI